MDPLKNIIHDDEVEVMFEYLSPAHKWKTNLRRILVFYCKRWGYENIEIAKVFKVNRSTICKDYKIIRTQYYKEKYENSKC